MASIRADKHRRLGPRVAGLTALGVLLAGALLAWMSAQSAGDAALRELDARAAEIDRAARAALASPGRRRDALEELARAEGAELALERAPAKPVVRAVDDEAGRTYRFPLGERRGRKRTLRVTLADGEVAAARSRAVAETAAASAAAAALFAALAWLLVSRSATLPLRRLTEAVERLGHGSYEERIEPRGAAELVTLTQAVNGLAGAFADLGAQASTDPLTGVANRRSFQAALEAELKRADRQGEPMALVVIDLDGFKAVNDSRGHPFGDRILRDMADRLRSSMRATDVLARVGGDEFAMILPGMDRERATVVVQRARAATAHNVGDTELTWCAGIACCPADARDTQTLLECADAALYCAKSSDERICHYDPATVPGALAEGARVAVEALLAQHDAIVPVFQPLISLATGHIAGYEALARFPNPPARRPEEWFELAHRAGLGHELEARAVQAALACPGRPAGTYLSFNLSPSAIASEEVHAVLPDDLSDFVIEITEHEQIADDALLHRHLDALRARSARVAIDDAGTGYSGLQQVMRVQPDLIKLDRSLVASVDKDPAKAALIDSFVRFGRRTGAAVCAEGIETAEELKLLADLDVSYGQGFGLARPSAPWARVADWVEGTIRVRRMGGPDVLGAAGEAQQNADLRLADVVARLAGVSDRSDLQAVTATIAAEAGADEVVLLASVPSEAAVEALTSGGALTAGERLATSNYRTIESVLLNRDSVQILRSDATADLGELALLGRGNHGSLLIAPIVIGRRAVGVMQCYSRAERHWTRSETSRARIIAHQLGPVIAGLTPSGHPARAPRALPGDLARDGAY